MTTLIKPYLGPWKNPGWWWNNIIELWRWSKSFINRGLYGYANRDVWDMSYYLVPIILSMLKHLKKNQHGHPANITEGEWNVILNEMILGFEAGKRVCNDEYYLETGFPEIRFDGDVQEWQKSEEEDLELFHKGMILFDPWFFALWD